jgi:hypothetical protein
MFILFQKLIKVIQVFGEQLAPFEHSLPAAISAG